MIGGQQSYQGCIYNIILFSMLKQYLLKREFFLSSNQLDIKQHYEFHKELGRGAYGVAYQAIQRFFPYEGRVVKRISKRRIRNPKSLFSEIHIMGRLDHPHVVKLYDTYEDTESLCLVMDHCRGGELYQRLSTCSTFNEQTARKVFQQMVGAVSYLHGQKVVHRDLKLQNFLMRNNEDWEIVLIDFGLSFQWQGNAREEMHSQGQQRIVGTAYYLAPEVLGKDYDERCDIWSLGVVLYMMVTGTPPFDGQNDDQIVQAIQKRNFSLATPQCQHLSKPLLDLINRMLQPESQRISFQQIKSHPWMMQPVQSLQKPLKLQFASLIDFAKSSKLKKITATYLASHLSEHEISRIHSLFQKIDTNSNGFISMQELQAYLGGQFEQLAAIFGSLDSDQDGQLNYNEFIACCLDEAYTSSHQYLRYVFDSFDLNRDGRIQREEFTRILRACSSDFKCNVGLVEALILENDCNRDGVIDFQEFQQSMLSLRQT